MSGRLLSGAKKSPLDRFKPRSEDYLIIVAVVCIVFALLFAFLAGFFDKPVAKKTVSKPRAATTMPQTAVNKSNLSNSSTKAGITLEYNITAAVLGNSTGNQTV
jgi:hypothetical protein